MNRFVTRGFALLATLALMAPAYAATSWVSTATKGASLKAGTLTTAVAATTPLNIAVGLKPRSPAALAAFARNVNTPGNVSYGKFLTPSQFTAGYAPTAAQAQAVADYLVASGFKNVQVAPNRLMVTASGNAGVAQKAFNTTLSQFKVGNKFYFANTSVAQVPAALGATVSSVVGLHNVPTIHTAVGVPGKIAGTYSPQDFQKIYHVGSVPAASSTAIAIFAFGDMTGVVSDLRLFENEFGLAQVPVSVVKTGAGPWTDDAGRGEWDMDTQTSTGLAGSVSQLLIYNGSSLTDVEMSAAFNRFVTDNTAKAGSLSVSGCEVVESLFGTIALEDPIFQQAAAQGQTIFASSGDTGATCYDFAAGIAVGGLLNGVPDGGLPLGQAYPASSPWVIAAGGTTLFDDASGNYNTEVSWSAGGGGASLIEIAPDWQVPVLPASAVTSFVGKGVPDVAMDADFLLSAAAIVVNGADSSNGGTSLSSPLALGAWARLQTAHNNTLGFAGPALYALAHAGTGVSTVTGFHDVVAGNNGLYSAHPGWDYTTGLGSFDIQAVSALVH